MRKPKTTRRNFLRQAATGLTATGLVALGLTTPRPADAAPAQPSTPNFLLITVDDMNFDAVGIAGCVAPDITPNIDGLARSGVRFQHAHVTIAVCQPSRSVLMTGRYPHRNGAMGFEPIDRDVPTLQEALNQAGYLNGIMGKNNHLEPREKFHWDFYIEANELGVGRAPSLYYEHAKAFFEKAKAEDKPFFLMANSHDPHRPFMGSAIEQKRRDKGQPFPLPGRQFSPDEIAVPPFLPGLPDVRREVAQYYGSVHRADLTVGAILRALNESGLDEQTIVFFLSDNGMAFPFAKTNCYLNSTRTPLMVRWPGVVQPGRIEQEHFISGIDFMPTCLAIAGIPQPQGMDGQSFLPLLQGKTQDGRTQVFTQFHETSAKRQYPMRCVQNAQFGYIFNAWVDGECVFKNESQSGLTMDAMRRAAKTDPALQKRVDLFLRRVPEELYDFQHDPSALNNLATDPAHAPTLKRMRLELRTWMARTGDPLLPTFDQQTQAENRD